MSSSKVLYNLMTNSKTLSLAQVAVLFCSATAVVYPYASGPDGTYAGVPGESTCAACHSGSSGSGNVSVSFPNGLTYTPGVKQTLTVTITDSAQRRWGFEMAARQSSNSKSQAGTFTVGTDGYTQLVCVNTALSNESYSGCPSASYPLVYIEQTSKGTQAGKTGSGSFTFTWTPPATDLGSVVIYVAGNAANNNGSESGDHIYTNRYTLTPVAGVPKPSISQAGVVNGASYQPGIAAGSWISIQGSNLSNTSARTWRADEIVNGALPTQLDGVSVTVNGKPAFIEYISDTQINAQAPSDAGVGAASVVVTVNGVSSTPTSTQVLSSSPAFFLWNGKYAVATRQDYSYIGPATLYPGTTTPAKPGDVVILWGTGFGPTTPAVLAGVQVSGAAYLTNAPSVTVGGFSAQVVGAALAPGAAGLYQIAIILPDSLPDGDLEVVAMADGVPSPTGIYITIQK